ncbi:MAG: dephospho-CoA kinase [Gammaproteobacteria bacterium]|nr:dephospho-CoA kinase [Gammaproteobacteria bacterium]
MFIIALTGGIASGKTTVAGLFSRHRVPIIDTDVIARALVERGQPALQDIVARFGREILLANGELDRGALRRRVFNNPDERQHLEAILHPKIHAEVTRRVAATAASYGMVVIPLLVESRQAYPRDRVLVVDTSRELQLARLGQRADLSAQTAHQILAVQASREARLAIADDVISNLGTVSDLTAQVDALHHRYFQLAHSVTHTS